jgi:hypothetical protein
MSLLFRLVEESSQHEKEDPRNWDLANQSKVTEGAVKKDGMIGKPTAPGRPPIC